MAYIRKNTEELTGYQEHAPLQPSIDLMCDFVMVSVSYTHLDVYKRQVYGIINLKQVKGS